MFLWWVGIALAVGLVVGGLLWILPSPAQRRRMALRERALAAGYKIRYLRSADSNGETLRYLRPWSELTAQVESLGIRSPWCEGVDDPEGWPHALRRPPSVTAVAWYVDGEGLGWIWQEQGDHALLEVLMKEVALCRDELAALPGIRRP